MRRRPTLLSSPTRWPTTGPTGGLPADDPRIWPNIVAAQLGWDLELIGRIGWTCRDVWWAATQDPRAWAALPRAGAVIFATGGMDSLPSPLPTALRELIRYVRPPLAAPLGTRRLWLVATQLSPVATVRAAAASERRVPRNDPWRNRFQPAGYPDRGVAAVGAHRRRPTAGPTTAGAGTVGGDHRMGATSTTCRWWTSKPLSPKQMMSGRGNPDGIHWNFEAHQAVAELMLKALAEAGVHEPESPAADAMPVVVVTDSSSRLPADVREKWAIRVVPLHILVDGSDLRDGVDDIPDDIHNRPRHHRRRHPGRTGRRLPAGAGRQRRRRRGGACTFRRRCRAPAAPPSGPPPNSARLCGWSTPGRPRWAPALSRWPPRGRPPPAGPGNRRGRGEFGG